MKQLLTLLNLIPFDAYVVGGAIRNILLGLEPVDYDLASQFTPDTMMAYLHNSGIPAVVKSYRYGTVEATLEQPFGKVEITTFRSDHNPDGRQCDTEYVSRIEEDLARRDFTVNAMAYGRDWGLIDAYNGKYACKNKILKFVGRPKERLNEDLLRGIRALRFAGAYDLSMSDYTLRAIKDSDLLLQCMLAIMPDGNNKVLTIERIVAEMDKIFKGPNPEWGISNLFEMGVLKAIIPEMRNMNMLQQNPKYHPEGDVWSHTVAVIANILPQYGWEALFHDIGKADTFEADDSGDNYYTFHGHGKAGADMIPTIAKRLKLSKKLELSCIAACDGHMRQHKITTPKGHRKFHVEFGDHMSMLQSLSIADCFGRKDPMLSVFDPPDISIKPILLGRHLLGIIEPTKEMGQRLDAAFAYQIEKGETDIDLLKAVALSVIV